MSKGSLASLVAVLVIALTRCSGLPWQPCDIVSAPNPEKELSDNGVITSPDYPRSFSGCFRQVWILTARPGQCLFLKFAEFDVGGGDSMFVYISPIRIGAWVAGQSANRTMIVPSGSQLVFFGIPHEDDSNRLFKIEFSSLTASDADTAAKSQGVQDLRPIG